MILPEQFRKGLNLELEGQIYMLIWFQHQTSGPHAGVMTRAKLKNVRTGHIIERTFKPGDKINEIELERRKKQFLYADGENFYFMDKETYEQINVSKKQLGKSSDFIIENMDVEALYYEGEILGVEVPPVIEMKVARTSPPLKTESGGSVMKPAILENEVEVLVPQFVTPDESVRIDTHTGEYMERVHEPKKKHK